MKTFHRSLIIGCSALALAGCGADEVVTPGTGGNIIINNPTPSPTPTPTPTSTLVTPAAGCPTIANPAQLVDAGTISGPTGEWRVCRLPTSFTASTTLTQIAGLLYQIDGQVNVGADGGPAPDASDGASDTNVVLTIQPGVILFASGSSFLNINRGNDIQANGTSTRPIIFTSRDNVQGLNNSNSSGQWGGVIINGRAPVTDCSAAGATPGTVACERLVEGATTPPRYGGATTNDNSGSMKFVQLRYSGFILSNGDELQSLTTGGVGSGTTFENIMSYNSSDDGVEFFGGVVNLRRYIVVGSEDDSLDTDTGVKASIDQMIAVQRATAGDTIIEADSSNTLEEDTPRQNTRITNATFIGNSATGDQLIRIRGKADFAIVNSILFDQKASTPCLRIDGTDTLDRAANAGLDEAGPVRFESFVLDCATDFRNSSGGVTAAAIEARYNAGSNNNAAFTNTLSALGGAPFINGTNENGRAVFNPTALSTYFTVAPTFIGAVQNTAGNWAESWTCNSPTITLGTANTGDCASLPVF
ncbi:hypothetical protein LY632_11080 [Erythrobacter sp. SDW2]|uniref:hypothetical protein n=1 Tax=Erythrobacter sp. SDW2 TaxID=2907154 RepID=UPI001F24E08A|nr:hypothetical protein [Erythrobacter sp. SDW2]UIP06230.1 hypothetical protein LY632_11080 [Erythrobacter sp. SDW2]